MVFKVFDRDGDGQISKEELKAVFSGRKEKSELMRKFEEIWKVILSDFDQNNDGVIDF